MKNRTGPNSGHWLMKHSHQTATVDTNTHYCGLWQ